tara:strand:- start:369 stop:1166 length:798 start_codon:yes stop_codon:yes gene_type:complete
MIAVSGQSGFIGKEFVKYLRSKKISYKCVNFYKHDISLNKICPDEEIKKINKCKYFIHFASSLNPKTDQDFLFNEKIPNYIHKKINKKVFFIYISSINVLIKDRVDKYSKSKLKAEVLFESNKNLTIIRLPLVFKFEKKKIINIGPAKRIFMAIDFFPFFVPCIYPGNIYNPIDVLKLNKFLVEILKKKIKKKYYNILGLKQFNFFEIVKSISDSKNKIILKINICFIKSKFPKFINTFFKKQNNFLNQFAQINNSKIKEKITYL